MVGLFYPWVNLQWQIIWPRTCSDEPYDLAKLFLVVFNSNCYDTHAVSILYSKLMRDWCDWKGQIPSRRLLQGKSL